MIPTAAWATSTILKLIPETSSARSIVLDIPDWPDHIAGQHVDVRLTATDGYQATRSYSLSSAPGENPQITVERVEDGEASTYLVDVALPGDQFEVRGPLGGYFIWKPEDRPLLLIGGGSGIAPLRSMWRAGAPEIRVLYSARTADRVMFEPELRDNTSVEATIHLTREMLPDYANGRIDHSVLDEAVSNLSDAAVYVCGPTAFVESIASDLGPILGAGYPIRTERFG